jgi:acetyl-CoA synthetase
VCFVVPKPGTSASQPLCTELSERVAHAMGKAKPEKVLFTRDPPKTRSAKIVRRVIRATYFGKEPGDVSSLENPAVVKAVTEVT